jgi:hypothetical protein
VFNKEREKMGVVLFWITCGMAAAGFLNAHLRAEFAESFGSARDRQQDLALALGASLLTGPFALFLSFFLTDFWADGWTLSASPIRTDDADLKKDTDLRGYTRCDL